MANKPKKMSKKRQLALATGKEIRPAYTVKAILTWIVVLAAIAGGTLLYFNRETVLSVLSEDRAQIAVCEVTKVNTTPEFDTSCGRYLWNTVQLPGNPSTELQVGTTYEFVSQGPRFVFFGWKPSVFEYKQV